MSSGMLPYADCFGGSGCGVTARGHKISRFTNLPQLFMMRAAAV